MKKQTKIHYDEEGDLLEISIGNPTKSYATEVEPGIFLRRDVKTDEVKSIEILGFKKRSKQQKDIEVNIPLKIAIAE